MATIKHLPNVPSLSKIIKQGTEGGKEFARIIDLLLFQDYRRQGKNITIFNDAAGDFRALDSFESKGKKNKKFIGYQYKFFTSPLSSAHRSSIVASLRETKNKFAERQLQKWILITPDDLIESGMRAEKGDVTWFNNLSTELGLDFEIEHWGHTKLIALFIETPSICLFYYPELVHNGISTKKTIEETKLLYDNNLISLYRNIEFVGMSIYKPEATRGIPMEHIYIPLNVIPESTDDDNVESYSIDPTLFLKPGSKTVILGDPGSGKSTLLRFLSLCGISEDLQKRYNCHSHERLTLYVVLRKYADELKSRIHLSILDYIQENTKASFTLKDFNMEFLEYYLETGQSIILFDGLDELPDSSFKVIIRDRINSLTTTYPRNSVIVTSRVVGYDNPFRFDKSDFNHYKLARLRLPEMETFVRDWYNVRIESKSEKDASVSDLIRILRDERNISIRELAENPLLLTIVTLVHRIDAVLPDERVVLYQKCTETLLNTWHTWKFKDVNKNRGVVERRNRRRMEAIAHWMQQQSVGIGKAQRSVVPYKDLLKFLTTFIESCEKNTDPNYDAIDLANEFIDFIKNRAGLLIEVGDESYSFVHLTFQEYLTATYLATNSEMDGITSIESRLETYGKDPRWYEVMRLLVGGLKSENSQEYIINKFICIKNSKNRNLSPQLIGGLLLDGVLAAVSRKLEIIEHIILCGIDEEVSIEDIRVLSQIIKNWVAKEAFHIRDIEHVYTKLYIDYTDQNYRIRFQLFNLICNLNSESITDLCEEIYDSKTQESDHFRLFFSAKNNVNKFSEETSRQVDSLCKMQFLSSLTSPDYNLAASVIQAIAFSFDETYGAKKSFDQLLIALGSGSTFGPFSDFTLNTLLISSDGNSSLKKIELEAEKKRHKLRNDDRLMIDEAIRLSIQKMNNILAFDEKKNDKSLISFFTDRLRAEVPYELENKRRINSRKLESSDIKGVRVKPRDHQFWLKFQNSPQLYEFIVDLLIDSFQLQWKSLWFEAIRVNFLPQIPNRTFFKELNTLKTMVDSFRGGKSSDEIMFNLANLLLFDTWRILMGIKANPYQSVINDLVEFSLYDNLQIRLAKTLRGLALNDKIAEQEFKYIFENLDSHGESLFADSYWKLG